MPRKSLVQPTVVGKRPDGDYLVLETEEQVLSVIGQMMKAEVEDYSFDVETEGDDPDDPYSALDPLNAHLVGCSISGEHGIAFYIPWTLFTENKSCMQALRMLLELKPGIYANAKFDFQMLFQNHDIAPLIKADTVVQQYVLDPDEPEKGLKECTLRHLGYQMTTFEEMTGGQQLGLVANETVGEYAGADADMTRRLSFLFRDRIKSLSNLQFIESVDTQVIPVIGKMELRGIKVDTAYLQEFKQKFATAIEALKQEIFEMAGRPFELDSNKQLGDILFREMGLTVTKRTGKTQQASTAEDSLEKIAEEHEIVRKILEYKSMNKMLNTFIEGILRGTAAKTGACHPSYLGTVVPTGRFACGTGNIGGGGYNLQQIPKTPMAVGDEKFVMRRAFVPRAEYVLGEADYKAIEFRIFLNMAKQETIIDEILSGIDVHKQTYAAIFDMDLKEVTKEQREQGKTFNYGLLYGMAPYSLAMRSKVTEQQAEFIINRFFERMDKVWTFSRQIESFAKRYKFVQTVFGRRRYIRDLESSDRKVFGRGLRGSVNTVIQGSAADIMRMALIRLDRGLAPFGDKVRLLLTTHDSITWEQHESIPQWEVLQAIKTAMEFPVEGWRLPMEVDMKLGSNWADAKEVKDHQLNPVFDIIYRGESLAQQEAEAIAAIAKDFPGSHQLRIQVNGHYYKNKIKVAPTKEMGEKLSTLFGSRIEFHMPAGV